MIVADSSVWISALRGKPTKGVEKLKAASAGEQILVGDIILLEILQGAQNERHARYLEGNLREYPIAAMFNDRIAVAAAAIFRHLRGRGITIRKSNDLIIATYCIEHSHTLLHDDRDFIPLAEHCGLQVG